MNNKSSETDLTKNESKLYIYDEEYNEKYFKEKPWVKE